MLDRLRCWLTDLTPACKKSIIFVHDVVLIWLSLWLALWMRVPFSVSLSTLAAYAWLFIVTPVVLFLLLSRLGVYRAVVRFLSPSAFILIVKAAVLTSLILALLIFWYRSPVVIPRSFIVNFLVIFTALFTFSRLIAQWFLLKYPLWEFFSLSSIRRQHKDRHWKVAIYGAGVAGRQLLAVLDNSSDYEVVAFIDDDHKIANRIIAHLFVYSSEHIQQLIRNTGAQEIFLAMPSITPQMRSHIMSRLLMFQLPVKTVPAMEDLAAGKVDVAHLRPIDIEDLLGRAVVQPKPHLLHGCIRGKQVMVTGGGGSIGSELSRQIIRLNPKRLIIFDHSEFNLYQIYEELRAYELKTPVEIVPILGSVQDFACILEVMERFAVETIYHAAAYKHVPLVQDNKAQGFCNNVLGTLCMAQAAIACRVSHFVLISTDKAVRPTNMMGATKRMAELVLQALSHEKSLVLSMMPQATPYENHTCFTMVRFGNVLGSSGSVIPKFRQQIQQKGPLTVTHPDITRYFMTITEAAELVIQASSLGKKGDVLLLEMGEPVKILDLAKKMIQLSGYTHHLKQQRNHIDIQYTGLRAGEKLYEELLVDTRQAQATEHAMIYRAKEPYVEWMVLQRVLRELTDLLASKQCDVMSERLMSVVADYSSLSEEISTEAQW